jgi:hypothetical protein
VIEEARHHADVPIRVEQVDAVDDAAKGHQVPKILEPQQRLPPGDNSTKLFLRQNSNREVVSLSALSIWHYTWEYV